MRPEDYWISLGEKVIGLDVLRDGENARQYPTYKAIVDTCEKYGINEIFDIGCNYGILNEFWRGAGFTRRYFGVDENPHAIAMAWDRGIAVHRANLRLLPYPDKCWDSVVIKDVIEHLESIEPLREAFRVSQEYVIISTYLPWHDGPSVIIQHPDGYYTNTYNRDEVVALAADCGFECIETIGMKETNGTPNEITVWRRV